MVRKVFIVTNDNVFFLLLKTFIESMSYFVVCEKITNHETIETTVGEDVKLIIIDGKMSDISPIELIHESRYNFKIMCNIWFITEVRTTAYLQKALEVGANRVIQKPFDAHELAREVIKYVL